MNVYVANWKSDAGVRVALVQPGRKLVHMVVSDFPVHVESRPLSEERYLEPIDYPVPRAVRKLLAFGKHGNITTGARRLLRELA